VFHADLNSLVVFSNVVDSGSFSGAARRLHMPVSTVSRRVAELEDQLGVRLLERSTRSFRLTQIGSEILFHAKRGAEVRDAIIGVVSDQLSNVSGTLTLSAPPGISESLIIPLVHQFQATNPDVRVRIMVADRPIDPIADGLDLVFLVSIAKDSSLVGRKLLTFRNYLVASPAYIETRSMPQRPIDLLQHRIVTFSHRYHDLQWQLCHVNGRDRDLVAVMPFLGINDYAGLAAALIAGAGLGELPPFVRPDLLQEGRLVEVMPEWRLPSSELWLVHIGNRHVSPAVRAFKACVAETMPRLLCSNM
jgi:DNA-binding transcriptional LysR family regulator